MPHLAITIRIANAATVIDDGSPDYDALADLVDNAAGKLRLGFSRAQILDYNGNAVGELAIVD